MQVIHIRESFKVGLEKFKERPWYFIGVTALLLLISILTTSNAVYSALSYIVLGGYIALLLAHYNGTTVKLDDMFDLDKRWIYFVFASILKGLLILLGFVALILPGIYIALRLTFVEMLVLDKEMRPVEALRASAELTDGHVWKLLAFMLCVTAALILGLLLLLVGIIPAVVITSFAYMHVYKALSAKPENTFVPASESTVSN